MPLSPDRAITESAAREVLRRAAELDAASGPTLRVRDIRAAGTQAGISAAALEAALEELSAREMPRSGSRPWVSLTLHDSAPGWLRPLLLSIAGAVGGLATASVPGGWLGDVFLPTLAGFSVLGVSGLAAALFHRRHGSLGQFHNDLGALAVGLVVGWSRVHGLDGPPLLLSVGGWWAAVAAAGTALVILRRPERGDPAQR